MISPNLALFRRSLRTECRSIHVYLFRIVFVLIAILMLVYAHLVGSYGAMAASGLRMFASLTHLNLVLITLLGIGFFSSVITEEKEINSLNLLLMTGITPFTTLLSKAGSKFVTVFLFILAQLPFTMIAITLGGVRNAQIAAAFAILLAYAFLLCAMALFCSTVCRRFSQAASLCLALVLAYFITASWGATSPFNAVSLVLATGSDATLAITPVAIMLVTGVVFFLLALACFNHFCRQSVDSAPSRRWVGRGEGRLRWFRPTRAWKRAVTWKDFHFLCGGRIGLTIRGILFIGVLALAFGSAVIDDVGFNDRSLSDFTVQCGKWILALDLIIFASRVFSEEIKWGTTPALLTLPVDPKRLVRAKFLAFAPMAVPALITIGVGFLIWPGGWIHYDYEVWVVLFLKPLRFVFYLYLLMYFSLFIRFGAFAVAAVIYFVIVSAIQLPLMMVFFVGGLSSPGGTMPISWLTMATAVFPAIVAFVGSVVLHKLIIRKFKSIGAKA